MENRKWEVKCPYIFQHDQQRTTLAYSNSNSLLKYSQVKFFLKIELAGIFAELILDCRDAMGAEFFVLLLSMPRAVSIPCSKGNLFWGTERVICGIVT